MKFLLTICIIGIVVFTLVTLSDTLPFSDSGNSSDQPKAKAVNRFFSALSQQTALKRKVQLPRTVSEVSLTIKLIHDRETKNRFNKLRRNPSAFRTEGIPVNYKVYIMANIPIEDFHFLTDQFGFAQSPDLFTFWPDAFKENNNEYRPHLPDSWDVTEQSNNDTYYSKDLDEQIDIALRYENGKMFMATVVKSDLKVGSPLSTFFVREREDK